MSENTALTLAPMGMSSSYGDIEIPRINVIQKMSEIDGPLGSIVLDKEVVIAAPGVKIPVVVIGAIKKWKEDVPFDEDYIPKIATTEAEANQIGSDSEYQMIEFAEIIFLIPQVGDDELHFPYPIGDANYQMGRITVQKDAYRMTYKRLFTFQTFNQSIPISTRLWSFSSELLSKGKYSWYVPTLSITKEETPEEVVAFVQKHLTGGAA